MAAVLAAAVPASAQDPTTLTIVETATVRATPDAAELDAAVERRARTVPAARRKVERRVRGLLAELSVAPLPTKVDPSTGLPPQRYLDSLVIGVHDAGLSRQIADETAAIRRLQNSPEPDQEALRERSRHLIELEMNRARLRDRLTS